MSAARLAERGGDAASGPSSLLQPGLARLDDSTPLDIIVEAFNNHSPPHEISTTTTTTLRTPNFNTAANARDSVKGIDTIKGGGKLDLSTQQTIARNGLLRDSVFPDWEDDAARHGIGNPDEMQKKDPLATQIWKLYSKTKTRLPNQERMENLTWRMMAMSLKRREQMQAALVPP